MEENNYKLTREEYLIRAERREKYFWKIICIIYPLVFSFATVFSGADGGLLFCIFSAVPIAVYYAFYYMEMMCVSVNNDRYTFGFKSKGSPWQLKRKLTIAIVVGFIVTLIFLFLRTFLISKGLIIDRHFFL